METTGRQDDRDQQTSAVTAALRRLGNPGIRFTPGLFVLGVLGVGMGLAFCIRMIFGLEGLARAWPPVGLFLTAVIALAVFLGRRASDMRRENVEAMLNMLQLARAEAEA